MTPLMGIRFIEQIVEARPIILKYTWVPIQTIPDYTIYAVMAAEDQKFVEHFGFDFDAILHAMEYNVKTDSMSI
jgi:monofunctional biosynthetic peptidoglycan transglycosylase